MSASRTALKALREPEQSQCRGSCKQDYISDFIMALNHEKTDAGTFSEFRVAKLYCISRKGVFI